MQAKRAKPVKSLEIPVDAGRVHEKVGPKDLTVQSHPVTPDTAVARINESLKGLGLKEPPAPFGNYITSSKLLDYFEALREYTDSLGRTRGYSLPRRFRIILLQPPVYNLAWDELPMFTFSLGLNRTKHDPKSGYTPQFWKTQTGPQHSGRPTSEWAPEDETKYPMLWTYYGKYDGYDYDGYDATCWASYHLLFPENRKPFLGVSALQNELLKYDDDVLPELKRLKAKAKSRWKGHYQRIIEAFEGNPNLELPYAFAYPNRTLLLPLVGLKMAHDLGVGEYAMVSKFGGGDHGGNYKQSCELLEGCETKVPITYPTWVTKQVVEGLKK